MLLEAVTNLSPATMTLMTAVATLSVILYLTGFWSYLLSPGPWGVPFLGYYPFLRKDFYRQLHELSKKHGEVYLINIAGQAFVYLSSFRAIKEANINHADSFSNRSNKYSMLKILLDKGLALMDGDEWKAQRKFFVQSLREAGHVRNIESITEAVHSTLEELHKTKTGPFLPCETLSTQTNTVLRSVMLGHNVTDEQVDGIRKAFFQMIKPLNGLNFLLVGPVAQRLLFPRIEGYNEMVLGAEKMANLMMDIIKEHNSTYDHDQPPRDFVDMYIREREVRRRKGDPLYKVFTDEALVSNLRQAYGDGSEAVAIFITSFLLSLSLHRESQDAIYDEIVRVVGTERLPTLEDRLNLPLIYSSFKELLRIIKFNTTSPGLESNTETEILGVRVPKGTITLVNMWGVHNDPDNYENPEKFDITRFMSDKRKVEQPIAFGVGKRACAGESFVMNEIFLFVTAIVQNFVILPETDEDIEDDNEPILDIELIVRAKLRVIPRKRGRYGSITPTTP